jgi:hypothetical protein
MRMEAKFVRRRRMVFAIVVVMITAMFTYATRDVCYVGQPEGNMFGYGSCMQMIDQVIDEGK